MTDDPITTADTSAEEMGLVSRNQCRHIITLGLVCVFLVASPLSEILARAQESHPKLVQDGERQLEDARTTLDEGALADVRRVFEECSCQDPDTSRCYYDLGLTESYLFQMKDFQKRRKPRNAGWISLLGIRSDPSVSTNAGRTRTRC